MLKLLPAPSLPLTTNSTGGRFRQILAWLLPRISLPQLLLVVVVVVVVVMLLLLLLLTCSQLLIG
jgi:hypothetical protein